MAVKKRARKKARKKKPVSAAVKKKAAKKKAPRKAKKKSHKARLKTRPLRRRLRGLRELREGIPALPIGDNGDLNEAIPTAKAYQPATGDVKAVMVFVEFPDVRHDRTVEEACSIITGDAKDWYRLESYGRLRFEVTPHGDWQMMPKETTAYDKIQSNANAHIEYISTALSLFPTGSINYDDYNIAYVVAAKTPKEPEVLFNSPTLSAGIEVPTNNGTVRHAVTFGRDSYERGFHVLLHETGHLFGLPDLYLFSSTDWLNPVGAWDIMCDLDLGQHFLGWHKYKLGWLDESQLFYLKSGEVSLPLAPFESAEGVKMILLPSESESRCMLWKLPNRLARTRNTETRAFSYIQSTRRLKPGSVRYLW